MSFSLWIAVNHPDGYQSTYEIVDGQTYNLSEMWRQKLIPPTESTSWLDYRTCAEMQAPAAAALLDYAVNTSKYEDLDPPNGWGDHEGFFKHGLIPFVRLVHQHPTGIIHWEG